MRRRMWGFGGLALVIVGFGLIFGGLPLLGLGPAAIGMGLTTYGEWAKCPHCRKKFARRGVYHNTFTRKCLNCGVRIGTPKETA
jgi:hypothetical protein